MDRILTRPIHSLFQIILERMELESLIGAITGIIVMGYAAMELQLSFYWYDFFLFLLMVGGGALVYGGIFVTLASFGFWSDAKSSIMPLMYNIGNYGRYPVDIYNRVIRFVLTFVLPFAFVGVYPAAYFFTKQSGIAMLSQLQLLVLSVLLLQLPSGIKGLNDIVVQEINYRSLFVSKG